MSNCHRATTSRKVPSYTAALAALSMALPAAAQETYFRAPLTGEKVVSYEVELPVARAEKRNFKVPQECSAVLAAHADGASQWGTQVVKSMWWKVESDCRYYTFLNRYRPDQVEDFVSGYDFRTVNLADLPINDQCGQRPLPPYACPNNYLGTGDIRQILPAPEEGGAVAHFDRASCQLDQGIFRGWVYLDDDKVSCSHDPRAPGFRIVMVDHADVNGDGYQDAILRMTPLGPRMGRAPAVLPVSRTGFDQPFFIPKVMEEGNAEGE